VRESLDKAVSLIWVAIAAAVLLDPPLAAALIVGIAVAASMAVVAYSLWWRPGAGRPSAWALRVRQVRHGSGGHCSASRYGKPGRIYAIGNVSRHVPAARVPSALGVATSGIYYLAGDWRRVISSNGDGTMTVKIATGT